MVAMIILRRWVHLQRIFMSYMNMFIIGTIH